ncbi:MAG: NAD-dependent epimerase/dehydratase family protein [Planctomycetota bacterium]
MRPQILVTGGSGFIGSRLVPYLLAQDLDVCCLVRESSNTSALDALGVETRVGDLDDTDSLMNALRGCTHVLHLAGMTKALRSRELWNANERGTKNLVDATLRVAGDKEPAVFVLVSSLAAAGPVLMRGEPRPRSEADPVEPVSNYGRSKRDGEMVALEAAGQLPLSIVRPPIVFGPGDKDGLNLFRPIARFGVHVAPGLRRTLYSLIHADDLSQSIWAVATSGQRCVDEASNQGIYFASHPTNLSYGDLGREIGRALGRRKTWVIPTLPIGVRVVAGINEGISQVFRRPHILGWDKSREAITRGWACDSSRLRDELKVPFDTPLFEQLRATSMWYAMKGWL